MTTRQQLRLQPGNWRKFDSFCWDRAYSGGSEYLPDAGDFAIVYTHNRDSDTLTQSNAAQIAEALAPFMEGDNLDVIAEDHNHWACGWIAGYAIRVYRNGEPTPAALAWEEIQDRLDDYPVLDEEDWSRRESDEQYEAWDNWVKYDFRRELGKVFPEAREADFDQLEPLWRELECEGYAEWDGEYVNVERAAQCVTRRDMGRAGIKLHYTR